MTKRLRQKQRNPRVSDKRTPAFERESFSMRDTGPAPKITELRPRNERQKQYLNSIRVHDLSFGLGPAGTGKTFLAAWSAAEAFQKGEVSRIIVTRPIVEAGENLGFLPGDIAEKIDPYFVPVKEALVARLGSGQVEYMLNKGQLMFVPFAFMRGRTFSDAFVILDEAQNTSVSQLKMFLTRAGEDSRLIVNGDLLQSDIPGVNGLADAVKRFKGMKGVGMTVFKREDVVRSKLAALAVNAYEGEDTREQTEVLGKLPDFVTRDPSDQTRVFA